MDISDLLKPNMEYPKNKKEIPMEQKHIWYVQGITCHNQRYPWYILRHWYIVWNCPLLYAQTQKLIIWVRIPGGYFFFGQWVCKMCWRMRSQLHAHMLSINRQWLIWQIKLYTMWKTRLSRPPTFIFCIFIWNLCRHNNVIQNSFQAESKPFKANCRPLCCNVKGWQFKSSAGSSMGRM